MIRVSGNKTTPSIHDFFKLVESLGDWGCIFNRENNLVACHDKFLDIVEEDSECVMLEDWLCNFHKQDRAVLRLLLRNNEINETKDLQVRLLVNDCERWVYVTLMNLSESKSVIIGEEREFTDVQEESPQEQVNDSDYFMTWLSLINRRMETDPSMKNDKSLSAFLDNHPHSNSAYQRMKGIFETIPHGFAVIGKDWRALYINPTLESIIGLKLQDVYNVNMWDVYPKEEHHNFYMNYMKAIKTKRVVHFQEYLHRVEKMLDITAYPYEEELILFVQDITEEKSYIEALRETEERFSLLAENVNEAFWISTTKYHTWEYISPSFEKIFGLSISQLLKKPTILLKRIHKDDRSKVIDAFKKMRVEKATVDYRFQLSSGEWRWIRSKGYPLKQMTKTLVVGVDEDITEEKEKEELQVRSDQYETVVRVAAGIAHEIRNPLTSIKGFLQLMMSNSSSKSQYNDIIFSELARIETIVNEFMLLAKPNEMDAYTETNVTEIIEYALSLFTHQINKHNIQVETNFDADVSVIHSDPKRLKQVFINIVKNALEAMDKEGKLSISTTYNSIQSNIVIKLQDNGKGMDVEQLRRIGEPFFTTKEKGTGLGIMVTTKFVESLGGSIQYDSKLGEGTCVTIILPVEM
ncbi:PAS domain-containing sensor histidine kinase [Pontibacillus litoralis]|uniref:histidine kinase n=1 Tax=Pontibacillus litoralis JSM 072002 TaxID=1385512 RepID=A0A0A5GAP5_9BACI|nr:PAS domain-containing sensor histidine kinase [Pontibacillus litoralis]KGX88268.1 hypothetical protein N784_10660 [Pontibacillus litoralis JSM 072002]